MSEKRTLAIIALLLGLLGGALLLAESLGFTRNQAIDLAFLLGRLADLVLGLAILLGSLLIYKGSYATGGILNIVLGVVALLVAHDTLGSVLGVLSGIIGLVANESRY